MDLKRKLIPVGIALAMVAVLFISWTPNWDSPEWMRSTKPFVSFDFNLDRADSRAAKELVIDIKNRLQVRHEWHVVKEKESQWQVQTTVTEDATHVQLDASVLKEGKPVDHLIVRGEKAVANELADRLVSLLSSRIEKAHKDAD
ncbi:signaling protein [Idiomarina piscisalsi]|uniref:Signaling protein n=1 Tax=Idiomarina piscisalsi TaxID=1096243 RepID=A0ABM6LRT7_9GAMM|nr:signaling protein [Idiomarina piscisalsi]ASG65248.1 signaling protein [Idiomarina piscisalsi]MTJ03056.1 signaling protein [Idiomarina piscisalsi]